MSIASEPWALLHRAYGGDCAYVARMNERGDATADLRLREHAHLTRPAAVRTG